VEVSCFIEIKSGLLKILALFSAEGLMLAFTVSFITIVGLAAVEVATGDGFTGVV